MKIAITALLEGGPGNFQSGQALVLAGPAGSAKSRIQNQVISGMLGGRSADPGLPRCLALGSHEAATGSDWLMIQSNQLCQPLFCEE